MFGLTLRERAGEAIRRGVLAALTGAYFHPSQTEDFGLTKAAASWLYTEALAHLVYALGYVSSAALAGKGNWATFDFFVESALTGMRESEHKGGPLVDQIAPVVFKRYADFEAFTGQQRIDGAHYRSSANLIFSHDSKANVEDIEAALRAAVDNYAIDIRKMFGV